jgi:hypothetical protein
VTIERAIELVARYHADQLYGADPYVFHLMRVMLTVPEECRVVAVLHDVLEDTLIDPATLATELSVTEWDALCLLTRTGEESYSEYILRLTTSTGPSAQIAKTVKRVDLEEHLSQMTPEFSSLEVRYRSALKLLG